MGCVEVLPRAIGGVAGSKMAMYFAHVYTLIAALFHLSSLSHSLQGAPCT